jgi:hypothetical protein
MLLPFWKVDGFPSFQVTKTEAARGLTADAADLFAFAIPESLRRARGIPESVLSERRVITIGQDTGEKCSQQPVS